VVVPPEVAQKLGLWPNPEAESIQVETATTITHAFRIPNSVQASLLDGEEILATITADLVIDESLIEPLITDTTIDALGIQVLSFARGLWRHTNDPPNTVRRSAYETKCSST